MISIAGMLLTLGLLLYVFSPVRAEAGEDKTRVTYLQERKDAVYENLRDFFVVRENEALLGCVALHIVWSDLAEVKSLAVAEEAQSRGLGSVLVEATVAEARRLGLERVFALTYRPAFFERLGFEQCDVMTLPRKVWNECYRCPKFPSCNEIALVRELGQ